MKRTIVKISEAELCSLPFLWRIQHVTVQIKHKTRIFMNLFGEQ